MKKSIRLNGILNVIRKCCNIMLPLLIFPYVSRVLGPDNFGRYSFSASVISYFLLTAMLGIETYAVREGSRIRDDKYKINRFISEIFSINILSLIFSYVILVFLVFNNDKLYIYKDFIFILSIMLPCTVLGREYINIIYEDYYYITIRYVGIQIIGILAIYLFVKNKNDYLVYTIIYMLMNSIGYFINLMYTRRYCSFKITKHIKWKQHIVPILILFGGQLAITIYVQSDITMLGFFKSDKEVGIYAMTSKIYMLIKGIINALTVVAIPRISYLLGENQIEKFKKFSNRLICYLFILVVPMMIGLILFSENILQIIGGNQYISGNNTLKVLSLSLFFAVFSGFFCNGIMVPNRKEKEYLVVTIVSAIVNILLNILFIPTFGMLGAAITTLVSEVIVLVLSFLSTKKYFALQSNSKNVYTVLVAGLMIIIVCVICKNLIQNIYLQLASAVLVSVIVYVSTLFILKNDELIELFHDVLK